MAEESIITRTPPYDDKAERSVIASMIIDRNAASEICGMLLKEDFYNKQYGIVFDALKELTQQGKPVDELVLVEKLKQMGAPEELCNPGYILELVTNQVTTAFATEHAKIVKNKAYLRRIIKTLDSVNASCYEQSDSADNIVEQASDMLYKLSQEMSGARDIENIKTTVVKVMQEIDAASRLKGRINGLPTGFVDLDMKLTGLHAGELLLVAARPAMGKTAFVLNIAHHVITKEKVPVAIFSLEMSSEQLVSRVIAMDSMVEAQSLKTGDLKDSDWNKIIESSDRIGHTKLFIDDNSSITIAEMRSRCRKLKQSEDIGLIIIDYLQLMNSSGKVESRQQFISEVSRALKGIARELKVPVIALSQLNRAVDSRPDHRPVLADLRESGAIEQDADVVMFIYRDDYYNPDSETPGVAEIIVAKQRNGSTGPVELAWLGRFTKFANLVKEKKQ